MSQNIYFSRKLFDMLVGARAALKNIFFFGFSWFEIIFENKIKIEIIGSIESQKGLIENMYIYLSSISICILSGNKIEHNDAVFGRSAKF